MAVGNLAQEYARCLTLHGKAAGCQPKAVPTRRSALHAPIPTAHLLPGNCSLRLFLPQPRLVNMARLSLTRISRTSLSARFLCALLVGLPASALSSEASDARVAALQSQLAALQARLDALERFSAAAQPAQAQAQQQMRVLARKLEIKEEEAIAALPNTPVLTAGEKGFAIASRDGSFNLKLRTLVHTDYREFLDDDNLPDNLDSFSFRRVRPTLEGTIFGIYDFRVMPDFAGSRVVVQDAWVDAKFFPYAKVRVGKFKTPVGLERLQAAGDIRFIERGLPTGLAPNRDLGIQLHGDVWANHLNYQLGIFNGVLDGGSSEANADVDNNGKKDLAARVFLSPFAEGADFRLRELGFGLGATYTNQTGNVGQSLLPTYRSPGQINVFSYRPGVFADGRRLRLSPQLSWYYNAFGLLAEHISVAQEVSRALPNAPLKRAELEHSASQITFNYVLTGEPASYKEVRPLNPFKIGAPGWGAWELVARLQNLRLDSDGFAAEAASFADPRSSISSANAWAVGFNWYLNRQIKLSADYEQTHFEQGATLGDRPDEATVLTRLQVYF